MLDSMQSPAHAANLSCALVMQKQLYKLLNLPKPAQSPDKTGVT